MASPPITSEMISEVKGRGDRQGLGLSCLIKIIGLLTFYCLLVLLYIVGIGLYAHRVWLIISKGGPMHEVCVNSVCAHYSLMMTLYPRKLLKVLKMLFVAMALHFFEALLMLIHLWRYALKTCL